MEKHLSTTQLAILAFFFITISATTFAEMEAIITISVATDDVKEVVKEEVANYQHLKAMENAYKMALMAAKKTAKNMEEDSVRRSEDLANRSCLVNGRTCQSSSECCSGYCDFFAVYVGFGICSKP